MTGTPKIAMSLLSLALAGVLGGGPTQLMAHGSFLAHVRPGGSASTAASAATQTNLSAAIVAKDAARGSQFARVHGRNAPALLGPNTPTTSSNALNAVTCVSSTDCWTVGTYSNSSVQNTLVQQYSGSSWTVVSSPNTTHSYNSLSSVACVSAIDCWAVGSYADGYGSNDQTLIEQYNGTGWSIVASPSPGTYHNFLYSVACPASNTCWAVGEYNSSGPQGLLLQFDGTAWTQVSNPDPGSQTTLSGVTCVSTTNCWAVGSYNNGGQKTVIEQYNGTNWAVITSANPGNAASLSAVTCVGASACWAVGSYYDAQNVHRTLVEQYNGTTWAVASSPNPVGVDPYLNAVACANASTCWTPGYYHATSADQTLMEQYNGTGWALINSPNAGNASDYNRLFGVACVAVTQCFSVGEHDYTTIPQTLIEQYDGTRWAIVTSPNVIAQPSGGAVLASEVQGRTNCACANADLAQSYSGDPVNSAYGTLTETQTDLSIPGRGIPLQFARTYNSLAASTDGPLGYGWTFNGGMSLSQPGGSGPVTISQEGGAQVVFNQSGSTYTPAAPRVIATLAQSAGVWTFVRDARNSYTFSATGQLLSASDLNGYTTTFAYSGGQLSTMTDPAGRSLSVGWTGTHITSVTDPSVSPNRLASFQYNDGQGNLTDVIDVNSGHTHYAYDSSHRLTNLFDPNCYAAGSSCNSGNGVVSNYDAQGRVYSQKDQLGRQTTWTYVGDPGSASGGTTTVTNPKGNVTVDSYQYGLLTQQTRGYGTPAAASWQYGYDTTTVAIVSRTDPNGNVTTYTVDSSGNQLSKTDALRQSSATYNAFNEPLTQTDGLNVTTTNTYDAKGNLQSVARPLLDGQGHVIATRTTQYKYTDASHPGDVTSMIDPDNNAWNYSYDSYGDPISATDPLTDKSTTTFNADGWKLTSVSPRGNVSGCNCASQYTQTYGYVDTISGRTNQFGDVATITDPLGHVTANHYDTDRNLISSKDGNGNTTAYAFDLANEATVSTRPDQTTVRTDYNTDGTVLDQKDGKNNAIVSYGYDALGRMTSQTDALGNTTSFTYDGSGNELTQQDPGGNCTGIPATGCTFMGYDADNQLTKITYSDGVTPNVSNIRYDADGQRVSMSDGTGTSTWVWDSLHRLTSFTDGHADQVQYQYNLRGLTTQITYPGSLNVLRGYDNAGRWTSVKDWLNNTTTVGYDPDSNPTIKTLPTGTGIADTSVFNAAQQLTSVTAVKGTSTTLFSATYGRDNVGQVTSDSSLPIAVGSDRYTQLNQLCYAGSSNTANCSTPPSGSQAYSFDAADNLTANRGMTQAFNAADQLCWAVNGVSGNNCATAPSGATQYTYNTRGDRTGMTPSSGSATSLGYDQANRLTSWTLGLNAATYKYNGDGLRMSKTVSGVTSTYTWDVSGRLPLLLGDGTSDYIYGPGGLPLEQIATRPAISRVGTATASGKSTSFVITLPAGVKANDQVFVASTEPSTTTVTASSGYASVASVTSGGTSPKATTVVFRHTVASGDTSVTLSYSTNTTAQSAVLAVYRGIDPSMPVDVSATGSSAGSTSVVAPSVTSTYANDELLVFQGAIGTFSGSSWTAPSGTTERTQVNSTANTSAGLADQALTAAGVTGTRTSTYGRSANLTTVMLAAPQPPVVLFYHGDQLGTTRILTDVVGAVRGTFAYDPYGNLTSFAGSYATPFGFSGQYQDTETGFIYLRARYYDPGTAQFLTGDSAVSLTREPYGYVGGNPLNATDPTGQVFTNDGGGTSLSLPPSVEKQYLALQGLLGGLLQKEAALKERFNGLSGSQRSDQVNQVQSLINSVLTGQSALRCASADAANQLQSYVSDASSAGQAFEAQQTAAAELAWQAQEAAANGSGSITSTQANGIAGGFMVAGGAVGFGAGATLLEISLTLGPLGIPGDIAGLGMMIVGGFVMWQGIHVAGGSN